jgi:CHAT domain-containing protein
MPRWTADPEATNTLLVEFHRMVAQGSTPADAMQKARATVRATPATAAPWYWSGWMVFGR